jgi:CO/xanthine dehydrogenase Mo-binding subunit
MGVMFRSNGYHVAAAQVTVVPSTGKVTVNSYTTVFDGGILVNPLQVKRNAEAGATLGLSEVMFETTEFNKSIITSTDWVTYPIMRMTDLPKINAVILDNPSRGVYGQGSEGFNGLPMVAVTAAFFDATGKVARTFPLRPANVKAMLTA